MKTVITLLTLISSQTFASAEGIDLAKKVYNRKHSKAFSADARMALVRDKKTDWRNFAFKRLELGYGKVRSLTNFSSPKAVAGTTFLSIDYAEKDSDQMIYLPALKKVRRISSSKKDGLFVGSDFYYEDLSDRVVEKDNHTLGGEGKYEGSSCLILISTPKNKEESSYSKKISCIHPSTYIPLEVKLYNKKGKHIKTAKTKKIEPNGGYLYITELEMNNLTNGNKTVLFYDKITSDDPKVKSSLFTREAITP